MLRKSIWWAGLGVLFTLAARTNAAESITRPDPTAIRALVRSGDLVNAERYARAEVDRSAGQGDAWTLLGDVLFRRGDFDGAGQAYARAVIDDPGLARAYLGLSRVEFARWRQVTARDLAAKAFRLDPHDPDVIANYAEFVSDPSARSILLQNIVALSKPTDVDRARESLAQLEIQRRAGRLATDGMAESAEHVLDLDYFRPNGSEPSGFLITARIDSGKPLRLVLDTGARGILVDARAIRNLRLEAVTDSTIGGMTGRGGRGRIAVAQKIAFGDLEIKRPLIEISDQKLTNGADGIIGLNVFHAFRIRVDAGTKKLQLGKDDAPTTSRDHAVPLYRMRDLLLVKTRVESGPESLFLLDTGAAYSSISPEMVRSRPKLASVRLMLPCGRAAMAMRMPPTRLDIGGSAFTDPSPLALDLRTISEREGVQISGVLGFPFFRERAFAIDYERGILELEPRRDK